MARDRDVPHHRDDIPMPEEYDDVQTDKATSVADSPLDADAPKPRPPKAKNNGKTRKVKEYDEPVPTEEAHENEDAPQGNGRESPYDPDSPLDADAEAALLMCEVDRTGPGEGQGWYGRLYDHGDGRGPQPVSYGRVGSMPDGQGIYERVQALSGGGQYRFVRKGKPPVVKTLSGAPKPLPSEQAEQAQRGTLPGVGFPGGYPGGFTMGDRPDYRSDPGYDAPPRDPFGEDYNPEEGIEPEAIQQGPTGWYRGGPYNRLIYYVNGVPSRPPRGSRPPAQLLNPTAGVQEFSVEDFDHSRGRKSDDEDEKPVVKLLEKVLERLERPQTDPMQGFLSMMQSQAQADALRRDAEREAAERRAQADREEANRRHAEETQRRENEFKLMMAKFEADKVAASARKADDVEIARINAQAAKETALAAAASAKEVAAAHAAANEKIIQLAMTKGDQVGLLKEGMQLALDAAEGRNSENPAVQIAEAIQTAAPALANAGKDVLLTWKGYGQPVGPPSALGGPAPPQLPGPAAPPAQIPDAQETIQNLQLVTYLVEAIRNGVQPKSDVLVHGCMAYGLGPRFVEVATMIQLATPEIVAAKFAQGAQAVGAPVFVNAIPLVQQVATSDQGRAWLATLKENVAKRLAAMKAAAQPRAAAPQAPAPVPAPAAKDPNADVDPTRPVIPNTPGPAFDPNAVDPTRPDIKPS